MESRSLRLFVSSLVALVALQVQAEAKRLPRLVVCITVDQLRADYLEELQPLMGEGGLRLMLDKGQYTRAVDFPFAYPNSALSLASLFTGAYPEVHSVEAGEGYLRAQAVQRSTYHDGEYQGNYTREALSPRALLVGTLGDRLKEASGGGSLVYSVAPNAEEALPSAGVLADGAYWLDSRIGAWSTTNYYPQMLAMLEQYNRSSSGPNKRLISGDFLWKPQQSYSSPEPTFSPRGRSFNYRYTSADVPAYKRSALVNEEVTDFALKLLEVAGYEGRKSPSLLSLTYKTIPHSSEELSAEDIDTYLRLDRQIARLLSSLDKRFGLANCLITLSGTGYTSYAPSRLRQGGKKSSRQVSVARLTALMNMFLTASYGSGQWILEHANGRIYLNHKLISNRQLDLERMQRDVADFLASADGVASTYAWADLKRGGSEAGRRLVQSTHARYRADIYWSLLPGWEVEEASSNPLLSPVSTAIASPFVLLAPELKQDTYVAPRDVRDIVRIICEQLRIRPPTDR